MNPANNTRKKVRGSYQNWFTPTLWPPIFTAVKQHHNIQEAMDFLRCAFRQPCDLSCVYDHLNRSTMNGWFHSDGTLRDTIKRCIELGTYLTKSALNCTTLASYPHLKKEIYDVVTNKERLVNPCMALAYEL